MSIYQAPMRGVPITLQSAANTGNGVVIAIPPSFQNHIFEMTGGAGVSAGAIQVESSDDPAYAGTWSAHGTPVTVPADTKKSVNLGPGIYPYLRARISTTFADGTVTVTYKGN